MCYRVPGQPQPAVTHPCQGHTCQGVEGTAKDTSELSLGSTEDRERGEVEGRRRIPRGTVIYRGH